MKKIKVLSFVTAMSLTTSVLASQVNVNHLAPFANTENGTEVSINVNGGEVFTSIQYLQSSVNIDLSENGVAPGDTLIEVYAPPGAETPAITATFDLTADTNYSVTAIGDGTNQPLALLPLIITQEQPSEGNILLRLVHAAPFAADTDDTAVSIRLDDGTVLGELNSVTYTQDSDYLEIPAGDYDLNVSTVDGSTRLIDIAPITLISGTVLNVFATGDGVNQPLGAYAVTSDGTTTVLPLEAATLPTRVNVAHLAPFAEDMSDTEVSVNVNGAEVIPEIQYVQTSGYLILDESGQALSDTMVDVFSPAGSSQAAIQAVYDLTGQTDYTVVAIGDGTNQPISLLPLVDDQSPPPTGFAKVRVVHAAPFSDIVDDTAVSIRTDDGELLGNLGALGSVLFGQASGYVELPVGLHDLNVATPDGSTVLIDLAPIYLKDGDILSIFATGDGAKQELGFYAVFGGGSGVVLPNEQDLIVLNPGLNGSWYNPAQDGQGFLIEILPEVNTVFASWYTFDTTESSDTSAVIGNSNQRWLTAIGDYSGTEAMLTVYSSQGGVFNQDGAAQSDAIGTMILDFSSCRNATIEYSLYEDSLVNSIDLTRISGSAVPFCESLK